MNGNVPFGMSGREAASYAHNAINTANKIGTSMMMWLMELLMQMLLDVLARHHEQKKLKGYDEMVTHVRFLEKWSRERYLELENDQAGGDQMVEFGQKLGDNLLDSMAPVQERTPEQRQKVLERFKEKHGIKDEPQPKGPKLEM